MKAYYKFIDGFNVEHQYVAMNLFFQTLKGKFQRVVSRNMVFCGLHMGDSFEKWLKH